MGIDNVVEADYENSGILVVWTATHYDTEIEYVRRPNPEELEGYAKEWQPLIHFGIPDSPRETLADITFRDVQDLLGCVRSNGSTPGCDNHLWYITEKEADTLRELNQQKQAERKVREAVKRQAERRRWEAIKGSLCPHCGTFCDGDCQAH